FQAEDGIRDRNVTGVQTCALPIFAASLPEPGPFTITSTDFRPCTNAALAAVSAAICAAYGVDFLEPLNPRPPALAHDKAFPCASVRVTIVLLKDDWICACPRSTFFLTRFFVTFFVTLAISKLTYFLLSSNYMVRTHTHTAKIALYSPSALFLLVCNGLLRTFSGSCIGLCLLTANR